MRVTEAFGSLVFDEATFWFKKAFSWSQSVELGVVAAQGFFFSGCVRWAQPATHNKVEQTNCKSVLPRLAASPLRRDTRFLLVAASCVHVILDDGSAMRGAADAAAEAAGGNE
jgi:hypothetical protein